MPEQQEQLSPQTLRGAKVKAEFAPAVDAAAPDAPATDGAAAEQVPAGSMEAPVEGTDPTAGGHAARAVLGSLVDRRLERRAHRIDEAQHH